MLQDKLQDFFCFKNKYCIFSDLLIENYTLTLISFHFPNKYVFVTYNLCFVSFRIVFFVFCIFVCILKADLFWHLIRFVLWLFYFFLYSFLSFYFLFFFDDDDDLSISINLQTKWNFSLLLSFSLLLLL